MYIYIFKDSLAYIMGRGKRENWDLSWNGNSKRWQPHGATANDWFPLLC